MLVSVIMPAYNAEKTLPMAVESVLNQTYRDLELIIVDDASSDKTVEVARSYAIGDDRVRIICNKKNIGVSKTRHKAVDAARGEWIAFLDSDDAWKESKLEKQIVLQQEIKGKLIFTGSAFMNENGKEMEWVLHVPLEISYKKLLKQNLISNSSVLVERQIYQRYETIGDEIHEDFACWIKMLRSGIRAFGIDEPLLIYRVSSTSKSGNKLNAAKMNWNTYRVVGMNVFSASYYMIWYVINGLKKYHNLK